MHYYYDPKYFVNLTISDTFCDVWCVLCDTLGSRFDFLYDVVFMNQWEFLKMVILGVEGFCSGFPKSKPSGSQIYAITYKALYEG